MKVPKTNDNEQGAALLVTLWVMFSLSIMLGVIVINVHSLSRGTIFEKDISRSKAWAFGGFNALAGGIYEDRADTENRISGEMLGTWLVYPPAGNDVKKDRVESPSTGTGSYANAWDCIKLPDSSFQPDINKLWIMATVVAEDAKLPLEQILKQSNNNILLQQIPNMTQPLSAAICHEREISNTEYSCMADVLQRVDMMTPERMRGTDDIPGFNELITTFSDGKIDINRTSADVLNSLPGLYNDTKQGLETVNNIINRLAKAKNDRTEYFYKVEDLKDIQGIDTETYKKLKPWIKCKTEYFRIQVKANVYGALYDCEGILFADVSGQKSQLVLTPGY